MRAGTRRAAFALHLLARLLAVAIATTAQAQSTSPPCLAEATLSASRVVVGEAVEHRIRILRRTDVSQTRWAEAPDFAGAHLEALPGGFVGGRVEREGRWYLVYEERRLLFPLRPGRISIGAARLECALHPAETRASPLFIATLAALPLAVNPVPAAPADWDGLVGEVAVSVQADRSAIALGGSLRIVASVLGTANLQRTPTPLVTADEDAELLLAEDARELEPGEPLRLRRTQVYDVVPRRSGTLTVEAIPLLYFDPVARRFARTPATRVEVRVRDATQTDAGHSAGPPTPAADPVQTHPEAANAFEGFSLMGWIGAAGVVAALVGGVVALRRAMARGGTASFEDACTPDGATPPCASPSITALRSALVRRLAPGTAIDAWTADELAALAPAGSVEATAAALLVELDRARFARTATPPDPVRVRDALRALGELS